MKADTPYDQKLIGIISTNPGVRMLALSGRVPVKIDPDSAD